MLNKNQKNQLIGKRRRSGSSLQHAIERLERRTLLTAQITGSPTTYATIQAAVDAAQAGDIITVAAGTYNEQVVINVPLTIEGAQTGVDARSSSRLNGSASESIVTGLNTGSYNTSAFYIGANDVTIDGFTVQGETNQSDNEGAGIVIGPGQSGTHITNNIVQNNVSGLFLANNSTTDAALIQHNVFRNNNNDGENGGRGIYTDEVISGGSLTDVTIDSNLFTNNFGGSGTTHLEAACAFEATVPGEQSGITITNNVMSNNGKATLFINATNITIDGNTVTGSQDQYSGSLRFEGNVQDVTIDGNDVHDNWEPGVAVDSKGSPGDNSGFVVNGNDFVNNNAAYSEAASVLYNASSYDGTFNAENNWWGSVSGPGGDGTGSGDAVSAGMYQTGGLGWAILAGGDIEFSPWSTSPNTSNANPPTAPTGLSAKATSATSVTLNWTDTAAGVENGFVVQRSSDGKTFANIGTTKTAATTFADTTATASTSYTYRVYATSDSAGNSAYSTTATVATPVAVVLLAPSSLTAKATSSTQVSLSWTDTDATVETGFVIQRLTGSQSFATVGTTKTGVVTFVDTTAVASTTYTYRVYATTASAGNSPYSTTAIVATPATVVLLAPTNLTAKATSSTQVSLSWTDTDATVETGFVIQRLTGSQSFATVGTTKTGVVTFVDTTAVASTSYTYRIYATTNSAGNSPYSTTAIVSTPAAVVLLAPSNLTAKATSSTQVSLSWTDTDAAIETGFAIQRLTGSQSFATVGTTKTGVVTFVDTTAVASTSYTYRVYATTTSAGNSPFSTTAVVATPAVVVTHAPTSLIAKIISTTQIDLSWTDTDAGLENGFIIQRSAGGAAYLDIATTKTGVTTFADTQITPGVTYAYRVVATSRIGLSVASNIVTLATHLAANAPTLLTAIAASQTDVNLAWKDNAAGIETGFVVQRSSNDSSFATLVTTAAGVVSYADTTAVAGSTYYYRVLAVGAGGDSAASAVVKLITPALPKAPTGLAPSVKSASLITLSWVHTTVAFETLFIIQRSTDNVHFSQIATTPITARSYADASARPGTTYYYRLQTVALGGTSANSAVVAAKTPTVAKPTIAAAPTGLKALAMSSSKVNLTWVESGAAATGFVLLRSTDSTHFTQIGVVAGTIRSYSDTTVSAATTYYYRIQSVSTGSTSAVSASAVVKTPAVVLAIAKAPTSLKAAAASSTRVNLTWVNPAGTLAIGFIIQRSTDGVHFTQIGATAEGVLNYADLTTLPGVSYTYRVMARSAGGNSAYSNFAIIKTPALPSASLALAPTALKASVTSTGIALAWTETSTALETGFIIERSTDGVTFIPIAANSAGVLTYLDSTATVGVKYDYEIVAVSLAGNSSPSKAVTVTR